MFFNLIKIFAAKRSQSMNAVLKKFHTVLIPVKIQIASVINLNL